MLDLLPLGEIREGFKDMVIDIHKAVARNPIYRMAEPVPAFGWGAVGDCGR